MPRYQWYGESIMTDILGALTALTYGYLRTSAALKNKAKYATVADAVVGAGGLIAKNYVGSPIAHEMFEALGFSGFGHLGAWAAAYIGKADSIPVWRPQESTSTVVQAVPRFSVAVPEPTYVTPPTPAVAAGAGSTEGNWEFEY